MLHSSPSTTAKGLPKRHAGPRSTRAECAHKHGPTDEEVPESASYGDLPKLHFSRSVFEGMEESIQTSQRRLERNEMRSDCSRTSFHNSFSLPMINKRMTPWSHPQPQSSRPAQRSSPAGIHLFKILIVLQMPFPGNPSEFIEI